MLIFFYKNTFVDCVEVKKPFLISQFNYDFNYTIHFFGTPYNAENWTFIKVNKIEENKYEIGDDYLITSCYNKITKKSYFEIIEIN